MKESRRLINSLVACGIALAMVSTLAAQTVQGSAKVVRIKGSARYNTGAGWQPVRLGAVFNPGTTIQTAKDSFVDLALGEGGTPTITPSSEGHISYQPSADQNMVRIKSDSAMAIDKLTSTQTGADVVTETQLDLQRGRILGNVRKMSAASKYEVKIPNGVAGIRGTIYQISVDGVLDVLEGSVVLAYVGPDGTVVTQVVVGGQEFDARTGQIKPIPPELKSALEIEAKNLLYVAVMTPTIYTVNKTLYYVSPIQGKGG